MLISEPHIYRPDPILSMISKVNKRSDETVELIPGVYEIGHFGGSHFMPGYEDYPELSIGPYGVCDSIEQLLSACPELEDKNRKFVVTLTRVRKADQPKEGGWRWHKWGDYIGTKQPQCEYLHDETNIDEVFCYHIYERI